MRTTKVLALLMITFLIASCEKETSTKKFTVTIENVMEAKDYFNSGATAMTGLAPGSDATFSFNAGKGQFLQFATMFVKSNDLFYAPSDAGIALYNANGNPTVGDVTSQVMLWDAGTEVNEMPGSGMNQPMNQSGANTGVDENGVVHLVSDAFTYPNVVDVISVSLAHDGGTMFTVTISNISGSSSVPTPLAPGSWAIHSMDQKPLFTSGSTASMGLESIAEDGDNSKMNTNLMSKSGYVSPFAPGTFSIGESNKIFAVGSASSSDLEALAEDGSPAAFTDVFSKPTGSSTDGPLMPTNTYTFSFDANEKDKLSFATMLVQSNDWFFGTDGLSLYTNGVAISGDITSMIKLYDAGTEVDEYAGAGNNQPARQAGVNTGAAENGTVTVETSTSANVPAVSDMIKVTISSK